YDRDGEEDVEVDESADASNSSRRAASPASVASCSRSSFQSTSASRIAPTVTAESATLNVQKRTEPKPMSMKSTTPLGEKKRSIRLPAAPPHARPSASTRTVSPGMLER